jgi:putative toxin-antitoxin system antitoxin component (TIGR02293 family)
VSLVEITARAIEILGTREKAIRWLNTPVRALGNRTPVSLLENGEGVARVGDVLGQIEHGVW